MFGDDEEILQDFIVEAGEILELLSEQLVELEQRPDDKELLNAIFRGFHTVKGGAGFLQLNAMVDCCHVTENLFDILRNGARDVTPELMDVVLQSLDTVNGQFQEIQSGQEPSPADPNLISSLEKLVAGEDLPCDQDAPQNNPSNSECVELAVPDQQQGSADSEFEEFLGAIEEPQAVEPSAAGSDISEDEFEDLLDQLHGKGNGPGATAPNSEQANADDSTTAATASEISSDLITEDEFEALLDQLHGQGEQPGKSKTVDHADANSKTPAASDNITDGEFEELLDQLHGKGKGPTNTVPAEDKPPAVSIASESAATEPSSDAGLTQPKSTKPPEPPKAAAATKPELKAVAGSAVSGKPAAAAKPSAAASRGNAGKDAGAMTAEASVRVDTQRLDDIMNMVGELVLVRNRLVRLGDERGDEPLSKAVSNLDVVTADLQSAVMKTRMQPIKKVFGRFPRVVRDLARTLQKEINLELVGEDTDLDKNLVEALADPLVHLVRNSVDHGIELPDIREQNNKPRVGKVVLSAQQEGDHILLSITDDGSGMDANKLRGIAVDKGVLDEDAAARLSDQDAFALIFAPGFSTKKEISDVSGRGVGMDVVKTKITQLNGTIEIDSQLGEGARFDIKVPLTLAIMPTLMIMLEDQTFALPLVNVDEIFHMDLTKTNIVDGQECITIREKAIPIFHLKHWLVPSCPYKQPKEGHVVIVSVGTQRVGFVVDQLIGQEEVVIKPLGKMLHGTPGMAGATITGDGTIALILDVPSVLKRYAGNAA